MRRPGGVSLSPNIPASPRAAMIRSKVTKMAERALRAGLGTPPLRGPVQQVFRNLFEPSGRAICGCATKPRNRTHEARMTDPDARGES